MTQKLDIRVIQAERMRQLDFYDPIEFDPKITIIGAGGIGSWVTLSLAKLGVHHLRVIDHDVISEHNLGTTPYIREQLHQKKVLALREIIRPYGVTITAVPRRYTGGKLPKTDILISTVDSMDARRLLFRVVKTQKIPFFIDGRIGGENLRVYAIQPGDPADRKLYKSTLVPNHRIFPMRCFGQQVMDVGLAVTSLITRAVRQWVSQKTYTQEIILKQDSLTLVQTALKTSSQEESKV